MKGLSMGDWSLIARYLKDEASQDDLLELDLLVANYPNLKMEFDWLGRELNSPKVQNTFDFDAETAFERLNERFVQEGLV
jgi:hypothetical protein